MFNPQLSVVIIGRNEGDRLSRCLQSVATMNFPGEYEIIYVDSSSVDDSCFRAESFGARVIMLDKKRPCAAKGRNAGWRAAAAPIVLFLDGDTVLHPLFASLSVTEFRDQAVAVVWGHRREMYPRASVYNRVLDLDWITPAGPNSFCGGDSLMRRSALEAVNGFDETLIAGEEPELCCRLHNAGFRLVPVNRPMTLHDLAMTRWRQYWDRAVRTGHAYAEVAARYRETEGQFWTASCHYNQRRAIAYSSICAASLAAAAAGYPISAFMAVTFTFSLLTLNTARRTRKRSSSLLTRLLYGVHAHVQHIPIFVGQVRFWFHAFTGRRSGLIEYKSVAADTATAVPPETTPQPAKASVLSSK